VAVLLVDSGRCPAIEHPNHVRAIASLAEARLAALAAPREAPKPATVEHHPSSPTMIIQDPIAEAAAPGLDPKVRSNAERSARVLVGDIELYFPDKVAQARKQGNLYAVMRDELDRSRDSFVERYGAELESQHQIFYQTVLQQLCQGDPSRLGQAPWAHR
jgi:gamma-glutamyl:cysteine ligase YbdK (ATP-grasp superfamily)